MGSPLLHLITATGWRAALAAGAITAAPFVHLSIPGQVALPASRLFAGRDDMLLLVLDPTRLDGVRFEEGDPPHPDGWLFPHAYAPVPASAVLAAVPYRPRPDGAFEPPGPLPVSVADRAAAVDPMIRIRAGDEVVAVTGGLAVQTAAYSRRYSANRLVVTGAASPDEVASDAEQVLGGWRLPHRVVRLHGDHLAGTAAGLAARGWHVAAELVMAAQPVSGGIDRVEHVEPAQLRALWAQARPGTDEDVIAEMLGSLAAEDAVTDVRFLAVREGGEPVAAAVLKIDGASASIGPLDTLPRAQRRGHGDALLVAALHLAATAGCDLLALEAAADDWPRHWYARRGFAEVGRCWTACHPGLTPPPAGGAVGGGKRRQAAASERGG